MDSQAGLPDRGCGAASSDSGLSAQSCNAHTELIAGMAGIAGKALLRCGLIPTAANLLGHAIHTPASTAADAA
eukprot:365233-Chlamydomonas_euryale.AAC.10